MAIGALLIVVGLIVAGIILVCFRPIFMVYHGEVVVVQRMGRPHRVLQPGLRCVWPIFEACRTVSWRHPVATRTGNGLEWKEAEFAQWRLPTTDQRQSLEPVECVTADQQRPTITLSMTFVIETPLTAAYVPDLLLSLQYDLVTELERTVLSHDRASLDHAKLAASLKSKVGELFWSETYGVKLKKVRVDHITWPQEQQQAGEYGSYESDFTPFAKRRNTVSPEDQSIATRQFLTALRDSGLSDPVLVAFIQSSGQRSEVPLIK